MWMRSRGGITHDAAVAVAGKGSGAAVAGFPSLKFCNISSAKRHTACSRQMSWPVSRHVTTTQPHIRRLRKTPPKPQIHPRPSPDTSRTSLLAHFASVSLLRQRLSGSLKSLPPLNRASRKSSRRRILGMSMLSSTSRTCGKKTDETTHLPSGQSMPCCAGESHTETAGTSTSWHENNTYCCMQSCVLAGRQGSRGGCMWHA